MNKLYCTLTIQICLNKKTVTNIYRVLLVKQQVTNF